jgi:hypothetical protein
MGTINGYIIATHADEDNISITRTMNMIVKKISFIQQHGVTLPSSKSHGKALH